MTSETREQRSRGAGWLILLAVVVVVLVLYVGPTLQRAVDPDLRASYRNELQQAAADRDAMRPLWLWAGRAFIGFLIALCLAGMIVVIGGAPHLVRWLRNRSQMAFPNQHGLYPAHVQPAQTRTARIPLVGASNVHLLAPPNERHAQTAAAFTGGNMTRIGASTVRQVLNPQPDEALLPSLDMDVTLPERVDIFSAPLPSQPALLLGEGPHGPITLELDEGGHVLIGGSPRSGKTNLIGSIVAMVARMSPNGETIQIALTDLKRIDFAMLPADLAILRWPVAFSVEQSLDLVHQVEAEMERRLQLLKANGQRTIGDYNRAGGREPYLLQIIDEIAQMSGHPDKAVRVDFSRTVARIGQLGAAAGIMQILATQRPSSAIITREITGICDTRIALKCAALVESMLILDAPGAEVLPSIRGRALIRCGDIQPAQTYYSGLRDGRFDTLMAALPHTLRLPEDAEADGLGADDLSSTDTDTGEGGGMLTFSGTVPIPVSVPDAPLIEYIWQTWVKNRHNLSETQRQVFGYDGGAAHDPAAHAINTKLGRNVYKTSYR